ncbi:MAG: virulence protein RhuM/Fic/DOC family protein [Bacteroidales bacterium]|nr:virulence protein RhuM/Fic/DOC family protein [Bacteroidales bacterium]
MAGTVITLNLSTIQIYNNIATHTNQEQQITPSKGQIILYQTADGSTSIDVKLEDETVWLSSEQMALLFERDRTVIQRHIRNIYSEGELTRDITCAKFAHMGIDADQTYITELYNLDVIISVGYRVKSKRGTQFRIWANSILKEYLIQGYAIKNGLVQQKYDDLKALVDVMGRTMGYLDAPVDDQVRSIFDVVKDYTYALDTLDRYDYQNLGIRSTSKEYFRATYENAMDVIRGLKAKFGESDLFANEKDQSFHSSIGQIYQTWDGKDLYPSVEEKAAMLLYLVVKNHSFTDGNKRIAATLFLWFMENNRILYAPDGHKRIADNALVALTLMIAESKTYEMDVMVKVVVNLINGDNK